MSAVQLSVIIPVRNMQHHIAACVSSLVADLGPGDEVIVVDDGSSDASATAAERAGARVIRNTKGLGPYHARNQAAAEVTNEALLFVDARSRGRRGLLDAHRALLAAPDIALSCTGVEVEQTGTLAGRIAVTQNAFRLDTKITGSGLDFYPTANLGVLKVAFDTVNGFRTIRSGADADFCWRVQMTDVGGIAADKRLLMAWVPRSNLRELAEQNFRYGKSSVYLETLHAPAFARARALALTQPKTTEKAPKTVELRDTHRSNLPVRIGAVIMHWCFRAGRIRAIVANALSKEDAV